MEKKGNILTQLALISDLFEKSNMECDKVSVTLVVNEIEFRRLFTLFSKKAQSKLLIINDTFTVKIGVVEFLIRVMSE